MKLEKAVLEKCLKAYRIWLLLSGKIILPQIVLEGIYPNSTVHHSVPVSTAPILVLSKWFIIIWLCSLSQCQLLATTWIDFLQRDLSPDYLSRSSHHHYHPVHSPCCWLSSFSFSSHPSQHYRLFYRAKYSYN